MVSIIQDHLESLIRVCKQHHVSRLDLFGSAAVGDFDPETSDLDFIVEFGHIPDDQRFDTFFSLKFALNDLFGRPVDLIEPGGLRNPYFIKRMNESRLSVYVA
jgi:predicted nucleotidyltransferase